MSRINDCVENVLVFLKLKWWRLVFLLIFEFMFIIIYLFILGLKNF